MRKQLPKPAAAVQILERIPKRFLDDGCSNSPDSVFGFDFRWACRIHDWEYCSRCHKAGRTTQTNRRFADREIKLFIGSALPWRWRWVRFVYYRVLKVAGGVDAWNSCGHTKGELCRHNMPMPGWMKRLAELD